MGRRTDLVATFHAIGPKSIPTESIVLDVSRWDEAKWSDGVMFKTMLACLDGLKKRDNNLKDTLIAETAIANGFILVTDDRALTEMARHFGGHVVSLAEFLVGEPA